MGRVIQLVTATALSLLWLTVPALAGSGSAIGFGIAGFGIGALVGSALAPTADMSVHHITIPTMTIPTMTTPITMPRRPQ